MLATPGYCPDHANYATKDKAHVDRLYDLTRRDKEARKFYGCKAWHICRVSKKAANPTCEVCRRQPTQLVHHRIPISKLDYHERLNPDNLQSMCWSCHSRLELARRKAGDDTLELETYQPIDWDKLISDANDANTVHGVHGGRSSSKKPKEK